MIIVWFVKHAQVGAKDSTFKGLVPIWIRGPIVLVIRYIMKLCFLKDGCSFFARFTEDTKSLEELLSYERMIVFAVFILTNGAADGLLSLRIVKS